MPAFNFLGSIKDKKQAKAIHGVILEIMDSEPGSHPEISERLHLALRAAISGAMYSLELLDGLALELDDHMFNQKLAEKALLKLLIDKGITNADEYHQKLIEVTATIGGDHVGTS